MDRTSNFSPHSQSPPGEIQPNFSSHRLMPMDKHGQASLSVNSHDDTYTYGLSDQDFAPAASRRELEEVLHESQVNMIALAGTIGIGIFFGSGTAIQAAGPGGACLAYAIVGSIMWAVISCLGEMTAFMPVKGPITELPSRFLDKGVSIAVGWLYWLNHTITPAAEFVVAAQLVKYGYFGRWSLAVWLPIFCIISSVINVVSVKIYGWIEYVVGLLKMLVVIALILLMAVVANDYNANGERVGSQYWRTPYSFFTKSFHIKRGSGADEVVKEFHGHTGQFLSTVFAMSNIIFSFIGMDIVAVTAAETKDRHTREHMKISSRKICIRVVVLYLLAVISLTFAIPCDDPLLVRSDHLTARNSPFVIAVVRYGRIPKLEHILNGFFIFSAFTAGVNAMYVSSRTMHALAIEGKVFKIRYLEDRLARTFWGVPQRALLVSAFISLLGFLGTGSKSAKALDWLENLVTFSMLIVYSTICVTYLRFRSKLKLGFTNARGEPDAYKLDREDQAHYPYRSHLQLWRAYYGLTGCLVMLIFGGWHTFVLAPRVDVQGMVTWYLGIIIFFFLLIIAKITWRPHGPWLETDEDLKELKADSFDIASADCATASDREGVLHFGTNVGLWKRVLVFFRFIWFWCRP